MENGKGSDVDMPGKGMSAVEMSDDRMSDDEM